MKETSFWHGTRVIALLLCFLSAASLSAQAQKKKLTGTVTDAQTGETLIGATVVPNTGGTGTVTNIDGVYTLMVEPSTTSLTVSYIGYTTKTVAVKASADVVDIALDPAANEVEEVVVVGYGTTRRSDLTGSVSTVNSKDFNKGQISSPEQLINGKVAGVQIMSNSGSATSGSTIRVRGGASLNASNDPLIVLDGVPLENGGISGNSSNFLSMINPSDIESMTVLKDASSTAIYGSRASNGVIIITTKKGKEGKVKVALSSTNSVSTRTQLADMMSTEEFRNVINTYGTTAQKALLGDYDTDWNGEVYRTGLSTDNNVSVSGKAGLLPYRVSLGYMNQNGLVRKDQAKRYTAGVVLNPSFFDDHLMLTLNAKGTINKNSFYNSSAIWAAATYNPTKPVYMEDQTFGGYYEDVNGEGKPITNGSFNPRGLIDLKEDESTVKRMIGSFDIDYKVHFLPELKLHATLGLDYAEGKGTVYVPTTAATNYTSGGLDYAYGTMKNTNRLLTLYANYAKYFENIKSNVEVTAGYDYQYWKSTEPTYNTYNAKGEQQSVVKASDYRHTLLSYYGRLNYSFDGKYLLTATVRRDGTSRFSKDNRWGTFPSIGLGWTMTEEEWLKDQKVLSNLKLRVAYGITGQQDGIGNYNYLPVYTKSVDYSQAYINGEYIYTYRPEAYVSDLKWETTKSWNFGFDFGFLNNRLTGGFDFYTRKTEDLIAEVPSAAGTNFARSITTNVGNVDSHGIEVSLNATPVQTKDWEWNIGYNFTWQKMKVKNLSLVKGSEVTNTLAGPKMDSYYLQVITEGYEPYMFYVYKQLYDKETGKPIEGAYADLDGDGQITSADKYRYHSPTPDFIMGLTTSLRWKKLTLGMNFRANIGNYVYNGTAMNTGALEIQTWANGEQLYNMNRSFFKTGFKTRQYLSDYYVENGSFLKLDNLNLSYDFGQITKWCSLTLSAMVQNVFCITNYSGTDPEMSNGCDSSFYPRPRTYSLSIGLQF